MAAAALALFLSTLGCAQSGSSMPTPTASPDRAAAEQRLGAYVDNWLCVHYPPRTSQAMPSPSDPSHGYSVSLETIRLRGQPSALAWEFAVTFNVQPPSWSSWSGGAQTAVYRVTWSGGQSGAWRIKALRSSRYAYLPH